MKNLFVFVWIFFTVSSCYQEDDSIVVDERFKYENQVSEKGGKELGDSIIIISPPSENGEDGDPPPKDVGGNGAKPEPKDTIII